MVWFCFSTTRWPLLGELPITITVSPFFKMISDAELSSEKKVDILDWKKKIGFFRSLLQQMPKMLFLWERGYPNAFLWIWYQRRRVSISFILLKKRENFIARCIFFFREDTFTKLFLVCSTIFFNLDSILIILSWPKKWQ